MKIYTRGGDAGETGLIGGRRVGKDDLRLEAYGTVDELNACLGLARGLAEEADLDAALAQIQRTLFVIGSHLAAPDPGKAALPPLPDAAAASLEEWIDAMEAELPALRNFILPGGAPAGAALHLARTICRRAERRVVALAKASAQERTAAAPVEPAVLVYLNRLSDFLFVAARRASRRAGREEEPWTGS